MTRMVQLADDAYEILARRKRAGESFSDLVRRTFPTASLSDLGKSMTAAELKAADRLWKLGRDIAEEEADVFEKKWKQTRGS